jgi:hypothetical protein
MHFHYTFAGLNIHHILAGIVVHTNDAVIGIVGKAIHIGDKLNARTVIAVDVAYGHQFVGQLFGFAYDVELRKLLCQLCVKNKARAMKI